ncbi:NAD(P)H-binding protein [Nibrella viscosa]|uniref:NAD(P)H-binding protein n=1 Tax=Nibrella viscosa TaxID=1084524 RepID=A0ABP8JVU6_9BACT
MTIHTDSIIAILGGSGKAGRPLVTETLAAGYRVRLLLRQPQAFNLTHERLDVIQGDVRDPDSLFSLLQGSTALLSTLGHTRGEVTPTIAIATSNYVAAMEQLGVSRCVVVTSLFATGHEQVDEKTQQAAEYMQQHYPLFMDDRRLEFRLLSESRLDWTYVRVPLIVQQPAVGGVVVNLNHLPGQQITAVDLARFLISQLTDTRYIRQAPFIASRPE